MRAKVSTGWSRDKKVLVRGAKGTDQLMIVKVRRKILRRVCIEGFICYGCKLETNSAVIVASKVARTDSE